jgi:DNA-binding protein H-NS
MTESITSLSERELSELIAKASRELESKRQSKRRETIAQIKDLAASIGVNVEIIDGEKKPASRQGTTVPIKYRDPENPENVWTGRGVKPRWLSALLSQGRSLEEFQV